MQIVEKRTKEIETEHTLKYLNNMYKMKEMLTQFESRKSTLEGKMEALAASVDKKLSFNKAHILDSVDKQKKNFKEAFRNNVEADVREMKQLGELEYNFETMVNGIHQQKATELEELHTKIKTTVNDDNVVYQKEEATRKILLGQVNFLKDRIKMEIESRKIADEDIQNALDKYKELIASKIMEHRNDIKKRDL